MPWTTPKTWSTNEVVTAANMNTHLRDNMSFVGAPPSCSVFNNAAQSVPTATFTAMTANSENWDTDTMHSTASNTSRITATTAGKYLFSARLSFALNGSGHRVLAYRVNGGGSDIQIANTPGDAAIGNTLSAPFWLSLAATDYIEIRAWQSSGGNLNITLEDFSAALISVP